jgi:hypothetical protein
MPKRLSITIAGAVSLGSFEAGVLYEVTHALGEHNAQTANPDEKIEIDVLTGASAGGMTATIAAQKLAFEAGALAGPYNNSFYLPWVADVSLEGLLSMRGADDATKSILSSEEVIAISRRYLTERYRSHIDPVSEKHPAAANLIRLGLALSNLNGVDYGVPIFSRAMGGAADKFVYTRHQDQLSTWIEPGKSTIDDIEDFWEPLRNAAVSCGAFPFAFKVVDVIRHASEYTEDPNLVSVIPPVTSFAYTDGGVFQNEPLGLAKHLVNQIDHHLNVDSRFYLFVAPGAKKSTANSDFNSGKANYRETALRLISSIFEQSRFQDWVTAEEVNREIEIFNKRAVELRDAFRNAGVTADALQPAASSLLSLLVPVKAERDASVVRLKNQFNTEFQDLLQNVGQPAADCFIDVLLTFETAARLSDREEMTIFGITAEDKELASSELFAFAGFFDRSYREHDYDVGRKKAQEFLLNPGKLGPIRFTPEPIRPIDPNLDNLKLQKMDRDVRVEVRERLRDRAHEILKEIGIDPFLIGGAVREAIDLALIKPQLDKLLMLNQERLQPIRMTKERANH